ncbi:lantibiotic dehydratase [Chitinophaga japonensis]|uniref:Thiopeptide-type bacteriocin biosynthesis protein n=1 Tax=Chitinophaga japonensis TaxID=104662 RepID=A0A562T2N4_CHIJA|nr:lantibiotic dehydratase [Chitinophaga japonensis]TWI87899.1 thiopeptide-type bacteriocin biosynthesis protein [Chitinophaga japonensis]
MITAKDFYLVRTPLLPLRFLDQFRDIPWPRLHDRLKHVFTDPYLLEAIYIASPELYQELQKWQEGLLTGEKEENKLAAALFRYLLRMCTRCTPYGLFAGCATGQFGPSTRVVLDAVTAHKKHCRLDMNYVAELAAMITQIPEIQQQLTYFPNNSLYRMADTYRYAAFTIKNKFRHYDLTAVNSTPYLASILHTAAQGATLRELADCITDEEITGEEAAEFIQELIESQLLLSELEPTVTGEEFFDVLTRRLETLQHTRPLTDTLHNIRQLLQNPDASIDKYLQTHTLVKGLLPDTNSKDLVQTDLFLSTQHNTISHALVADIQQQVIPLWKLTRLSNNTDLQQFCNAFRARYEEQEVPLVLALDTDAGIGYAGYSGGHADHTPLIDDIHIQRPAENNTVPWSKLHDFQLKKLHECLRNGQTEIVLTDADLDELKETDTPEIPDSLYLMGSILGSSAAAIDAGDYRFELSSCGGPSAANLLGRFCHGDALLADKVQDCLREEAQSQPDCIYAEIIHLPEARTGNILLRPQLRDYEIVYLGNGSVPAERQLPLSDLLVSVQQQRVVLRSKKFNKRVIPRLSTAHNYRAAGLPVYKFLCDLQYQQLHTGLYWQWHNLSREPFLPGVRYGKIILDRCRWTLHKKDYPELNTSGKKSAAAMQYPGLAEKIRAQLQLPRYLVIAEGDNELFIDMDNEACRHILLSTLVKREQLVLQEFLGTADRCWVESPLGRHTNEVIIPMKSTAVKRAASGPAGDHQQLPARRFTTGSEWLYVKIYCGTSSAEKLLKTAIKPLTTTLVSEGVIDKWFFLRYSDPEHHIRIRFHHSTDPAFWKTVLEQLHTALQPHLDSGLAYKLQTDTYEREIERYGARTMELSEDIFYYDSVAVLDCIDLLEGEEGETYRWLLAARGIDMLLQDAGYALPAKAALLKQMQQGFFREFGGDKSLQQQLNDRHRAHMRQLADILNPEQDAENGIEEAIAIFTLRSMRTSAALQQAGLPVDEQLSSYIHMFLNRMLLSNQRKHELVIYHCLSRHYDSQLAILKNQSKQLPANHGLSNL